MPDFRNFMKMAAERKCLPSWWEPKDNAAIETMAMTDQWANIKSAVEKDDISEHYDSTTPMMLRMLAEAVTGKSLNG